MMPRCVAGVHGSELRHNITHQSLQTRNEQFLCSMHIKLLLRYCSRHDGDVV